MGNRGKLVLRVVDRVLEIRLLEKEEDCLWSREVGGFRCSFVVVFLLEIFVVY